ncbi:MAG: class I SAM-dependent methyltransferase [Armatimonadota bacterium]|nr:class I SAM-dependent methyltransferase [Armatimonadota bacterium]MDR7449932.1 class I SAM-dependent methyltransferase [Armatimonadota bacterium]MDR7460667.1 class I SAM-dependent methyltransferase [Armatimonadota bacterium]MDR7478585.1 class I SAM-dependent methyltransferase [Armatimonadota bacterium]MDR7489630.1 class I SAM-dependent methyltransferase [Armatimonadota bacterium]
MSASGRRQAETRALLAAVTDAGYLLQVRFPGLGVAGALWSRLRYGRLSAGYARAVARDPAYLAPLEVLLSVLGPVEGMIVESGAGTGTATARLLEANPDAPVVAVDRSAAMLSLMEKRSGRVVGVVGDAFRLPVARDVAALAISHNAPCSLVELARVTRRGGHVALVLSAAGRLPACFCTWALRARPADLVPVRTVSAGRGRGWLFRKSEESAAGLR